MTVFEIITPGYELNYADIDWSRNIKNQISSLESTFFEANTALNLFIEANTLDLPSMSLDDWERDRQHRSKIQRMIEQERGTAITHDDWNQIQFETDVRFKREQWSSGRIPQTFKRNQIFIYAKAFLYALDTFDKFLGVLVKEPNVPKQIVEYHGQMSVAFPHLRGVRNTAHHLEDRARGLGAGQHPRPLELQPITSSFINTMIGGILVLNNLNGSRYGCTMADGNFGEVDVSLESMEHLKRIFEGVLASFQWRGERQHWPS